LNQPLTIIKTTAYLLKNKVTGDKFDKDEFVKYFEKIDKSIERMSSIIGNMKNMEDYQTKNYAMGQKIINLLDSATPEVKNDK